MPLLYLKELGEAQNVRLYVFGFVAPLAPLLPEVWDFAVKPAHNYPIPFFVDIGKPITVGFNLRLTYDWQLDSPVGKKPTFDARIEIPAARWDLIRTDEGLILKNPRKGAYTYESKHLNLDAVGFSRDSSRFETAAIGIQVTLTPTNLQSGTRSFAIEWKVLSLGSQEAPRTTANSSTAPQATLDFRDVRLPKLPKPELVVRFPPDIFSYSVYFDKNFYVAKDQVALKAYMDRVKLVCEGTGLNVQKVRFSLEGRASKSGDRFPDPKNPGRFNNEDLSKKRADRVKSRLETYLGTSIQPQDVRGTGVPSPPNPDDPKDQVAIITIINEAQLKEAVKQNPPAEPSEWVQIAKGGRK